MEPFLGMIVLFGFKFAPQGWALCDGSLLAINQNSALFSLLGTTYGGDGRTTFALPDLRGRLPIHYGQGPGLSNYVHGEMGGVEMATLLVPNLPVHNHILNAISENGDTSAPAGAYHSNTGALDKDYKKSGNVVKMNEGAISNTGSSKPFSIMQPYLVGNYCIATQGIYPSRP